MNLLNRLNKRYKLGLFARGIWFFPALLTCVLIGLTAFEISGSSIGTYHSLFYGAAPDRNLLLNEPRLIRSDEWLANSQMALAQQKDGFKRVNENIGLGQDVSLLGDIPYIEWSSLFKPHNLAFFVMPFDNAFAFKWWVMGYMLILSCYFFVLSLMPKRTLLAALVSLALFFAPFIQWWYLYGSIGTIAYALFGGTLLIKLLNENRRLQSILWGLLLSYVAVCFCLVMYPPFQIACALAMLGFVVGYSIEQAHGKSRKWMLQKSGLIVGFLLLAGLIVGMFFTTRFNIVKAVQDTAYPGQRTQSSGGFDANHLLSSHLSAQFQSNQRASNYKIQDSELMNQSESSNFILLFPFLLFPALYLSYKSYKRRKKIDWPLLFVNGSLLILLAWLFIPGLPFIGKLTLLEIVPHSRLLIGIGILNILQLLLFIQRYSKDKLFLSKHRWILLYTAGVFLVELWLSFHAVERFPDFIGAYRAVAYAVPIPLIIYFLLRKRFILASIIFAFFSIFTTFKVNPLYVGTDVISTTPLSIAIQDISKDGDPIWATDHFLLENFVAVNNGHSLSGVYLYPQLSLWSNADPKMDEAVYNRYAHVVFSFNRDSGDVEPTELRLLGGDIFSVITEPCSQFLEERKVGYLLTNSKLSEQDDCLSIVKEVRYPTQTFYIYKLHH